LLKTTVLIVLYHDVNKVFRIVFMYLNSLFTII